MSSSEHGNPRSPGRHAPRADDAPVDASSHGPALSSPEVEGGSPESPEPPSLRSLIAASPTETQAPGPSHSTSVDQPAPDDPGSNKGSTMSSPSVPVASANTEQEARNNVSSRASAGGPETDARGSPTEILEEPLGVEPAATANPRWEGEPEREPEDEPIQEQKDTQETEQGNEPRTPPGRAALGRADDEELSERRRVHPGPLQDTPTPRAAPPPNLANLRRHQWGDAPEGRYRVPDDDFYDATPLEEPFPDHGVPRVTPTSWTDTSGRPRPSQSVPVMPEEYQDMSYWQREGYPPPGAYAQSHPFTSSGGSSVRDHHDHISDWRGQPPTAYPPSRRPFMPTTPGQASYQGDLPDVLASDPGRQSWHPSLAAMEESPSPEVTSHNPTAPLFIRDDADDPNLMPFYGGTSPAEGETTEQFAAREQIRRSEAVLGRRLSEAEADRIRSHYHDMVHGPRPPSERSQPSAVYSSVEEALQVLNIDPALYRALARRAPRRRRPPPPAEAQRSGGQLQEQPTPGQERRSMVYTEIARLRDDLGVFQNRVTSLENRISVTATRAELNWLGRRLDQCKRTAHEQCRGTKRDRSRQVAGREAGGQEPQGQGMDDDDDRDDNGDVSRSESARESRLGSWGRQHLPNFDAMALAALAIAGLSVVAVEAMMQSKRLSEGYGPYINGGYNSLGSVMIFGAWEKVAIYNLSIAAISYWSLTGLEVIIYQSWREMKPTRSLFRLAFRPAVFSVMTRRRAAAWRN